MKVIKTALSGLLSGIAALLLCGGLLTAGAEDEMALKPRVPPDRLAMAEKAKNPFAPDAKSVSSGKAVYHGKGVCFSCHGEAGRGDGAAGASFEHRPRDFGNTRWQHRRTDGEIFWAITEGTEYGMLPFGESLSEEERWHLVNYIRALGRGASPGAAQAVNLP